MTDHPQADETEDKLAARNELLLRWAAQEALVEAIATIEDFIDEPIFLRADGSTARLSAFAIDPKTAARVFRSAWGQTAASLAANWKRLAALKYGVLEAEFRQARKDLEMLRPGRVGGGEDGRADDGMADDGGEG